MESDCCDQESSSARWERSHCGCATLRMQARSLWYLSLCQACYHVNSVQRIVIFLSVFFFFLSLVVLLCFSFSNFFTPTPLWDYAHWFQGRWNRWREDTEGDLGTAATFSSFCGFLPHCATEEIFIFHMRKCVVCRDGWFKLLLQSPRGWLQSIPSSHKISGGSGCEETRVRGPASPLTLASPCPTSLP